MPSPQNWASAEPENPAAGRSHGDSVWPLVCTLIVLVVLALTDKVGRAVTVFPF